MIRKLNKPKETYTALQEWYRYQQIRTWHTQFDYQAAEGTAIVVTDTTDGDNVQNSVIVLVMVRWHSNLSKLKIYTCTFMYRDTEI